MPFAENIFFREFARFFRGTSHFRGIEMFCFQEIMLPVKYIIRAIVVSGDLNLLFWEIEISHFREIAILQFSGD